MNSDVELFYEDAKEQLLFMENALITMQENGVDEESLGALFRAMHTIKGTAGMFGYDEVVGFTHVAENLLSEVRQGNVELTPDMIDTFLEAKDHSSSLIELSVHEEDLDDETLKTQEHLLMVLTNMMPGGDANSLQKDKTNDVAKENQNESIEEERLWHISFRLKQHFYTTGMDIINTLDYFNLLGELKNVLPITSHVPLLKDIKPTEAYMGYEILFLSDAPYAEIEEVFEFIMDAIELKIFKADDKKALLEHIEESSKDEELQEKLIKSGFYKNEYFAEPKKKEATKTEKLEHVKKVPKKVEEKKSFSLRVDSSKIDQLINKISEMVIANAKISQRADTLNDSDMIESATILSDMLEEIRSGVMNIRMVQVGDSFNKFKRIVHDVSKKVGKDITFEIQGGETELDKMVVEKISDPIMHMLRNSIDHGIETAEDRALSGKEGGGKVTLNTYPDSGTIVIEIEDDGKGLPRDLILQKAIDNGIIDENHKLSDKDIYNLIFLPGLSTAKEVSDISGRGVGMDVVKRNIEALRGTVDIDSTEGKGSKFTIRLPLTLAIIDGFLVQSGNTKYIIPLDMIQECIELDETYKSQMKGNEYLNLRDFMLPILDIRSYFNETESKSERLNIVVVRYGDYKIGMMVDELYGEFQTVIKPIGSIFNKVPGISGGTILGSGEIALIFDIPKLMEHKISEIN